MAEGFRGLKKDDHEKLRRAAGVHERVTGEGGVTGIVDKIPVQEDEADDAEAKAKRDEAQLKVQAKLTKEAEDAAQKLRQAKIASDRVGALPAPPPAEVAPAPQARPRQPSQSSQPNQPRS